MAEGTLGPSGPPELSIIVPAHNEEPRLPASLEQIAAFCRQWGRPVELVLVDDGSTDGTLEAAFAGAAGLPPNARLRLVCHAVNRGKGAAVRSGAFFARGDHVVMLDADLATPPAEIPKVLELLAAGFDVVAGTRVHPGGVDMRASQPLYRRLAGKLFTRVRAALLVPEIDDTQCPLKGFRRQAALAIFPRQRLDGWSFDAEVLYIARRLGLRLGQVPVAWRHVGGSRMRITPAAALRVLSDLLRIRRLHRGIRRPADAR